MADPSASPAHYALHVICARNVLWDSNSKLKLHRKQPGLYIKVKMGSVEKQTRSIKLNSKKGLDLIVTWDEILTFPPSPASSGINIQLKQKSIWSADPCVGFIDVELADLLKLCSGDSGSEAKLSLHSPGNSSTSGTNAQTAILHLTLRPLNQISVTGLEVELVGNAVQRSNVEHSAEFAGAGDAVTSGLTKDGDLYESFAALFMKLDLIVKYIDDISRIHPYLNAAWQLISVLYKGVSYQFKTDKKVLDLVQAISDTFDFARDTQTLRNRTRILESRIIKLLQATVECCQFLQKYLQHGFAGRILDWTASERIDEFLQLLRDRKTELDSGLTLHNALVAARASEQINIIFLQQRLGINDTTSDTRQTCLENTRVEIRRKIIELLKSEGGPSIVWLHGVAGSGKSTIATTIEDYFRNTSQLGAFLKFERGKSDPSSVIRTIAFKLALFDSAIGSLITKNVNQDKDISSSLLAYQFDKLLLQPLNAAWKSGSPDTQDPVIIILDALDECGTPQTRKELIRLLKDEFLKLPPNYHVLVTSRPESDIVKGFSSRSSYVCEIELDYTSDASCHDVLSYLKHELQEVMEADTEVVLPKDWSWDANIAQLGEAAGGLFIWASTAVRLVSLSDNPFRKLKELVSDSRSLTRFGLDELYASVLRGSGISWGDDESKARFSKVLALLLFGKIPLSNQTIDAFLSFPPEEPSHLILSRLRCLLVYTPGEPIRLFHASFADYLQSPDRSADPWFIDISEQKQLLAAQCFTVMKNSLHFNMCDLETSYLPNDNVMGLEDRVKERIPTHLDYACQFWAQHLICVPFHPDLLKDLSDFAYERLLFWFEVLSLRRTFRRILGQALRDAATWAEMHDVHFSAFLRDASSLATIFATAISHSTPHIYVSMLPLTEKESEVSAHYSKQMTSMVRVHQEGVKEKPLWLKVLEGHSGGVWSVCFSADGKRIISGSEDKTIRVSDAETGDIIRQPFEGHTESVLSVAIVNDGSRIVSGSKDRTIRVWSTEDGSTVLGPLEGHADSVASVDFSPDGKLIASGSWDKTICLWNADTGSIICDPLEGHMDRVNSVVFSPNGIYLASGSDDMTIRVWDVKSGGAVGEPFRRHTDGVLSVAFSPDSTRIASGSRDQTVRVWDVVNGDVVAGPFLDHTESVWSVIFSPDGTCIASSANDNTIRTWDIELREVISGPFTGHSGGVLSTAFSPDGSHIVSGSWDQTIRLWDARSSGCIPEPMGRHIDSVLSVAFSPDDSKVLSGSWDRTIRIWDLESDTHLGPLEGHLDAVWSVSFTPDGKRIISGSRDSTVRIWNSDDGTLAYGPFEGHTDGIFSVAVSSDGARVASGSNDQTVRIWEIESGSTVTGPLIAHTDSVWSVAFSPDAARVVSASRDRTLIVWNAASGDIIFGPLKGHTDTILSVAYSPAGDCFASCSWDKTVRVWSATSGQVINGPFEGHAAAVWCIAFSPDGAYLASGSRDNTVRLWDVSNGSTVLGPFDGHVEGIYSVTFSHDGKYVASGSRDKTIRLWDVENKGTDSKQTVRSANDSRTSGNFSDWILAENGWVLGNQRKLLMWIPPDLRTTLWRPRNVAILSCPFSTKLNFQNTALGARWRECFRATAL